MSEWTAQWILNIFLIYSQCIFILIIKMISTSNVVTHSFKTFHILAAVNWEENSQSEVINENNTFEDDQYYEECVVQEEKINNNKYIYNAFLIYLTFSDSWSFSSQLHLSDLSKRK